MNAESQMIIHFPIMHPALVTATHPAAVRFLDPGIVAARDPDAGRYYRPPSLAYQDGQARAFLEDSLNFGGQFKHTADMAYYQAATMNDFFSGSMQDIKSELLSPGKKEANRQSTVIADAQLVLLLGFHLEQRMTELDSLGTEVDTSVRHFEKNLGLDEEDRSALHSVLPEVGSRAQFSADWRRLMAPFLRFLPAGTPLFVTDPGITSELAEQGIQTRPCTEEELAHLFPGETLPGDMAFAMGTAKGQDLVRWAGGSVPENVSDTEYVVVTMVASV